jgi:hypothetical protein
MQWSIAMAVKALDERGVGLDEGLHLLEVAFSRGIVNGAGEGEGGAGNRHGHEDGEAANPGKG